MVVSIPVNENVFPVKIYILFIKRSENEINTCKQVFL